MGSPANILLSFLRALLCRRIGWRLQKPESTSRQPTIEVLEYRVFPSRSGLMGNLSAQPSAGRNPPSAAAVLTQPVPPIFPEVLPGNRVAGNSMRPGSITVSVSASAQGAVLQTSTCPGPLPWTPGPLRIPSGVNGATNGGLAGLLSSAQVATGSLTFSSLGANITLWLEQLLAGLTQLVASIGSVARDWIARFADVIRSWTTRIVDLAEFWIPRSTQIGNSWLQQATLHLAAIQDPPGGPDPPADPPGDAASLLDPPGNADPPADPPGNADPPADPAGDPAAPGDPAGEPLQLPSRAGCGPGGALSGGFPGGPFLSPLGGGPLPEESASPFGAKLSPGQGGFGESSGGGGGGGGGGDDNKSASHGMFVSPPPYIALGPPAATVTSIDILFSPMLPRPSDYPSNIIMLLDDDSDMDDPDMGDADMDDPAGDGMTPDASSSRSDTSSSSVATVALHHPEREVSSSLGETAGTVVVGVVSGVISPRTTASAAAETNVTVVIGIVMPADLLHSSAAVSSGLALPAPAPEEWTETPAPKNALPITEELAALRLSWQVHHLALPVRFFGAGNPLPITDKLAALCLAWPVQSQLMEAIVLAAVTGYPDPSSDRPVPGACYRASHNSRSRARRPPPGPRRGGCSRGRSSS
jgi:hypothetical protein